VSAAYRLRAAIALVVGGAFTAHAQTIVAGVQAAGGAYQEQGPALDFTGWGPAVSLDGRWKNYEVDLSLLRISFSPSSASSDADGFDMTQFDGRARWSINAMWSVEAGYLQRTIAPTTAAQGMSVIPVGGRIAFDLAPGAKISAHVDYLAAAKFSGGGSAPFALELGLNTYYAPGAGSLRFTADFAFDRIDRQTTSGGVTSAVPIQSSIVALGVALAF
jgi:hypothetical protein